MWRIFWPKKRWSHVASSTTPKTSASWTHSIPGAASRAPVAQKDLVSLTIKIFRLTSLLAVKSLYPCGSLLRWRRGTSANSKNQNTWPSSSSISFRREATWLISGDRILVFSKTSSSWVITSTNQTSSNTCLSTSKPSSSDSRSRLWIWLIPPRRP